MHPTIKAMVLLAPEIKKNIGDNAVVAVTDKKNLFSSPHLKIWMSE